MSTYKNGCVEIPGLFRDTFNLSGGEEVTLIPQTGTNCLLIFMGPTYSPILRTTVRRLKATVSDNPGASSALYKAIEANNHQVRILSAQGTTTGRNTSAVGDLLLHVPHDFDDVGFVLKVLEGSRDCTISDLTEQGPIESSSEDWRLKRRAHIEPNGKDLRIPTELLGELGQHLGDAKEVDVIINWDTETTVLALTLVRSSDMTGFLVLFSRDIDHQGRTGEVGGILRKLGFDFLWLQINHLGNVEGFPFLLSGSGHVKRWIVAADLSNAATATEIEESLERSGLFYGGLMGGKSRDAVLFGALKMALSRHASVDAQKSASALLQWAKRLWSTEDEGLSSVASGIG